MLKITLEPEVAAAGILIRGVPVAKDVMVDCIVHELTWSIARICELEARAEVEIMSRLDWFVNNQERAEPLGRTRRLDSIQRR